MSTLKFLKIRNVKSPTRAHAQDAGIDFYVPEDLTIQNMLDANAKTAHAGTFVQDPQFYSMLGKIVLNPGESVLIPSGIKVDVPDGYMMMYDNKSGVSTKKGLLIGAKIVDIGYQGECHLNLHNVSDKVQEIFPGDKICQAIMVKIGFHVPEEVKSESELYGGQISERGEGGFGSSGTTATDVQDKDPVEDPLTDQEVKYKNLVKQLIVNETYGRENRSPSQDTHFVEFEGLDGRPIVIRDIAIEGIEKDITPDGEPFLRIYTSYSFHEVKDEFGHARALAEGWIAR